DLRRYGEAWEPLERALALHEPLARTEPGNLSYREQLAYSLRSAGYLHRETKRLTRGEPLLRQSSDLLDALAPHHPEPSGYRMHRPLTLNHPGLLLAEAGRRAEAIPPGDRALAINEALMREAPDLLERVSLTAGTHNNRGLARAALGRHEEAMDDYRK